MDRRELLQFGNLSSGAVQGHETVLMTQRPTAIAAQASGRRLPVETWPRVEVVAEICIRGFFPFELTNFGHAV